MSINLYDHDFYKHRHKQTSHSTQVVLSLVLDAIPPVHSAIDFGCGVGTWLSTLKQMGVSEIQGVDGPWVNQDLLEISPEEFRQASLEEPNRFNRRYDLAITLEVAEHISEERTSGFIDSLTDASDFILFSAAIPFQGGQGHINEQWPDYWAEHFARKGYTPIDFIRTQIWNDKEIPTWYRQNILLFVKSEQINRLNRNPESLSDNSAPLSLVHPELYHLKMKQMTSIRGSWRLFKKALWAHIKTGLHHKPS